MKHTLNEYEAADRLCADENASWSRAGALALARFIEEHYPDEWEFDVVELRCDYTEHTDLRQWAVEYFGGQVEALQVLGSAGDEDLEDVPLAVIRKFVNDSTSLIEFDGGVIVGNL